ncbi:MAG TPA: N-acetylmuramoyl-L-alanine amidase, partial [Actinopolymorphaceae bacterium]
MVAAVGSHVVHAAPASAARHDDFGRIIDCDAWGARPPSGEPSLSAIPTNKIIVHHMAFPNVTDYSREQAIALARECQDLHMDGNGWMDTGQHFTVSRGGYVLEGRHRSL